MSDVLQLGAALKHPPVITAISDAAALGITGLFRSETTSGVLDRFYRTGSADRAQLIEAARVEQGFASPEGARGTVLPHRPGSRPVASARGLVPPSTIHARRVPSYLQPVQ